MTCKTFPYYWNPAHSDIIIEFDYEAKTIITNSSDGGNLRVSVSAAYTENSSQAPVVGDYMIIKNTANDYYGRWAVLTVHSSTSWTLDVAHTGGSTAGISLYFERRPEITIYKGYNTGELYATQLPLTLVAVIQPQNTINNDISLNLRGWAKDFFDLTEPASSTDTTMFTRIRLKFDGTLQSQFYHVVNSAIEPEEFNEYYADTGYYLVEETLPYVMGCGNGILTKVTDEEAVNVVGDLLNIITSP